MNAQLKALYLQQIGLPAYPYPANGTALNRLYAIYNTGNWRFNPPFFAPPGGAVGMTPIWNLLQPFVATPALIPAARPTFDAWARSLAVSIGLAYSQQQVPSPLGVAQKTLNLFLKDLWAHNQLTPGQESCLHAPIDSIVIKHFQNIPDPWNTWTKVKWATPAEQNARWDEYLGLQYSLRGRCALLSVTGVNLYPIMLEQLIWGKI